jgi:hypothetical protein
VRWTTRIQITLDITHDDDIGVVTPAELARRAGEISQDAITWTDDADLKRATDGIESPVVVVRSVALVTRDPDATLVYP